VDSDRTSVSSIEYPAATQGPDGVFADPRNGEFITYRAAALDVPALLEVNRNEARPLTRTEDDHRSSAGSSGDKLIVDGKDTALLNGVLDTLNLGLDQVAVNTLGNSTIQYHQGSVTQTVTSPGSNAIELTQVPLDPDQVSVIAYRPLALASASTANDTITLTDPITEPTVVRALFPSQDADGQPLTRGQGFTLEPGASLTLKLRADLVDTAGVKVEALRPCSGTADVSQWLDERWIARTEVDPLAGVAGPASWSSIIEFERPPHHFGGEPVLGARRQGPPRLQRGNFEAGDLTPLQAVRRRH
jgi:hypothetical protein